MKEDLSEAAINNYNIFLGFLKKYHPLITGCDTYIMYLTVFVVRWFYNQEKNFSDCLEGNFLLSNCQLICDGVNRLCQIHKYLESKISIHNIPTARLAIFKPNYLELYLKESKKIC